MLRAAGSAGGVIPSIGLSIQGEWSATTAYSVNQIVTYNGSSYYAITASTGTVPGTDSTVWGILAQGGATGTPGVPGGAYGASRLTGGYVFYTGSGLIFTITAATYIINGTVYSSAQTNVTLTAADATNPRIDAFALTTSGTAIKVDGTAAASPSEASVDPLTQLKIGTCYVAANATTPGVTTTNVYLEDTEWTSSVSGAGMNKASTSNPFAGTKDIEATAATNGQYVNLANGSAFDTTTRNQLNFNIRSKAAWASAKSVLIQWYNSTTAVGTPVTLKTGAYGFNSGSISAYQLIIVPLEAFGVAGLTVTDIRFTVTGGGAAIGFYLDNITLQGGITSPVASDRLRFKGAYSAAVQYVLNDVVTYNSALYVALAPTLANLPTVTTSWTPLALINPLTTGGDVLYGGASGLPTRLANGSANNLLQSAGGTSAPTWSAVLSVTSVADTKGDVREIPQNSKSAAYTTVLGDAGKHIYHPSSDNNARTFTIDSNANVAYPVGTAISFVNEVNTVTIAITSDTLTLQGDGSTGSRTLAANNTATALKVASTKWVITGSSGLT